MARNPLAVFISLDRLHCYDEGDGWGSAEPYLWTVFFKVDGDSVVLGDDLHLHGTATITTTPGSHGNLGDGDVDGGEDRGVPAVIGRFQTILRPIPIPDWLRDLGRDNVGGVCGVAAVLMEEDWVSDAGAEAGHRALNDFVQQAIDSLIPTLGILHPDVTDDDIKALTSGAESQIASAVQDAQGVWDNFTSWLNPDDHIGDKVWTFSHDTLVDTPEIDFSQRWDNEGDWELFGNVSASSTCPVEAVTALLQALGLISESQAKSSAEAAHEFRKRNFAGSRELGAWWQLAERNAAAISGVLRRHPEQTKRAAVTTWLEVASATKNDKPIAENLISHATELLETLVANGPRRLRIDAKAALSVLPTLRGKTLKEATEVLKTRNPTRKINRLPRQPRPR